MYGLIAKVTVVRGKRDEMIAILREGATAMSGCLSYVVARDSSDENAVWVSEVWDSVASHDASLSLHSVKNAMLVQLDVAEETRVRRAGGPIIRVVGVRTLGIK